MQILCKINSQFQYKASKIIAEAMKRPVKEFYRKEFLIKKHEYRILGNMLEEENCGTISIIKRIFEDEDKEDEKEKIERELEYQKEKELLGKAHEWADSLSEEQKKYLELLCTYSGPCG